MERRILTGILLITSFLACAQEKPDFVTYDSMTYSFYLKGDWDNLIKLGNRLISEGMDYKFLRQRLGYAYFMKEDYTAAKINFRRALTDDSYNAFTNEYLFYSFLNTGKEENAGQLERRIDPALAKKMKLTGLRPVDNIDVEFNYKVSGSTLRSAATFYRFGLGTRLGCRLRLYQSFSDYMQTITLQSSARFSISQPGYYARLGWNISKFMVFSGAYHLVHVEAGNSVHNGHLFLVDFSPDFNRFIFESNASFLRYAGGTTLQAGIQAGYIFPGRSGFYLKATGALKNTSGTNLVSGLSAGSRIFKRTWLDMNFLSGDMDRYNDFRGMYVYNSYDPLILRTGATINYFAGGKFVLWINLSLERKKYLEDFSYRYNQFSYLGGIRWKI